MDLADEAARAGAPEGLVIVADEQTRGRGRRGHLWSSPARAGLYFSLLLRPVWSHQQHGLSLLTIATGVAVRDAIQRATGLCAQLKWPNDVMIGRRKLAGILAEATGAGSGIETVILGVGINVLSAAHPDDVNVRATSLQAELGRDVQREALLDELLACVWQRYDELRRGDANDILRQWRAAAPSAVGAAVEWSTSDGAQRGTTIGIDDDGALLVKTTSGSARIVSGEVAWL